MLVVVGVRFRSLNTCSYPSMLNLKSDSFPPLGVNAFNRLSLIKTMEEIAKTVITVAKVIDVIKVECIEKLWCLIG